MIDPYPNPVMPRSYHERTGHVLRIEDNPLQQLMEDLKLYAKKNHMIINIDKTKVMIFNRIKSVDIIPQVKISDEQFIEIVEVMKLLGIIIVSDLTWKKYCLLSVKRLPKYVDA